MPTLTTDVIPQRLSSRLKSVAAFTVRLLDADTANNPPLANFRAKVERLNNAGKPDAVLVAGRANKDGEIRFHLNLPKGTFGQPNPALPRIKLTVLDQLTDWISHKASDTLNLADAGRIDEANESIKKARQENLPARPARR